LNAEIAELRRRVREDPRSFAFVRLAEALRRQGDRGQALAVLRAGLRHHPDLPTARVVLARIHLEAGARALALAILEEVANDDPENIAAGSMLAGLLVEDGRLREARVLLDRLQLTAGHDPVVQSLVVRASPEAVRLHGAVDDPFDTAAWADRLASQGDYPRATRAWQRIFQANPRDRRARGRLIELSRALDGLGDGGIDLPEPHAFRHRIPGSGEAWLALLDDHADGPEPSTETALGSWARLHWSS
jgi:predicted Zn-dependent protease